MKTSLRLAPVLVLLVAFAQVTHAQESAATAERSYPFAAVSVRAALEKLGAYQGARLPSLDGFIKSNRADMAQYQRIFYEYKIGLEPRGDNQTVVRVKATVSAWYEDPTGANSGYQAFESNGRLEDDLLARLTEFLDQKGAPAAADAQALEKQIEDVQRQRKEAEDHNAALERQIEELHRPQPAQADAEYISITSPRASILSEPRVNSEIKVRAVAEDEFELLERRGPWLRVKLEDNNSGWVRAANARLPETRETPSAEPADDSTLAGFTVVRELVSTFSGDWPRLKGKQATYVWVRPEGSALNVQPQGKLRFAQSVFVKRYREEMHSPTHTISGVVVIYLDLAGGVAAATMDDIKQLAEGAISAQAFVRKCSLDPASAFDFPLRASGRPGK